MLNTFQQKHFESKHKFITRLSMNTICNLIMQIRNDLLHKLMLQNLMPLSLVWMKILQHCLFG